MQVRSRPRSPQFPSIAAANASSVADRSARVAVEDREACVARARASRATAPGRARGAGRRGSGGRAPRLRRPPRADDPGVEVVAVAVPNRDAARVAAVRREPAAAVASRAGEVAVLDRVDVASPPAATLATARSGRRRRASQQQTTSSSLDEALDRRRRAPKPVRDATPRGRSTSARSVLLVEPDHARREARRRSRRGRSMTRVAERCGRAPRRAAAWSGRPSTQSPRFSEPTGSGLVDAEEREPSAGRPGRGGDLAAERRELRRARPPRARNRPGLRLLEHSRLGPRVGQERRSAWSADQNACADLVARARSAAAACRRASGTTQRLVNWSRMPNPSRRQFRSRMRRAVGASGSPTTEALARRSGRVTSSVRPSGDHSAAPTWPSNSASCRGSPPPSGRIQGWDFPERVERKSERRRPSGENRGTDVVRRRDVICSARPPRSGTRQSRVRYSSPSIVRRA